MNAGPPMKRREGLSRIETSVRSSEVLLFPYLPLAQRRTIGPWLLIPREQLTANDTTDETMIAHAQGVARMYRMTGHQRGFGAFIRHDNHPVGEEVDSTGLRLLYHAVVVSLLDQNPSRAVAGAVDDCNSGHRMATTENALLFGHRFGHELFTGFETGTMVVMRHLGPKIGETEEVIPPPADLHLPTFRPQLDHVYAQALYEVISRLDEDGPDLPGAIRWLELAWTNSASIDTAGRILALRAGFDVLFGGARTLEMRGKFSELVDERGVARTHREWDDHGRRLQADLTDLEWWFQSFALLRNKIAHGGEIPDAAYLFDDGIPHHWHGEWQLRRAIKRFVANAGYPNVLLDAYDRAMEAALPRLEQALAEGDPEPAEGTGLDALE
jgi:hypothetical protein